MEPQKKAIVSVSGAGSRTGHLLRAQLEGKPHVVSECIVCTPLVPKWKREMEALKRTERLQAAANQKRAVYEQRAMRERQR